MSEIANSSDTNSLSNSLDYYEYYDYDYITSLLNDYDDYPIILDEYQDDDYQIKIFKTSPLKKGKGRKKKKEDEKVAPKKEQKESSSYGTDPVTPSSYQNYNTDSSTTSYDLLPNQRPNYNNNYGYPLPNSYRRPSSHKKRQKVNTSLKRPNANIASPLINVGATLIFVTKLATMLALTGAFYLGKKKRSIHENSATNADAVRDMVLKVGFVLNIVNYFHFYKSL